MKFRKGESPNPGGVMGRAKRERLTAMVERAVVEATRGKVAPEDALPKLLSEYAKIALSKDESTRDRIAALQELIDRGLGRVPNQNFNLDLSVELKALSNDEIEQRILTLIESNPDLRERFRGIGGAPPGARPETGSLPALE